MGATGAGKSALALAIAASRPTVIINADAIQMVASLRVLTARPTVAEEAQAEHALYGVLQPVEPTSVAVWLEQVESVIRRAWNEGKLPLLVGGTGMYLHALMHGLAAIPPVPEEVRARVRGLAAEAEEGALHHLLQQRDSTMAARLKAGDTQRILRALEVMEATGISLATWQAQATAPLFPEATYRCFRVTHPRAEIYRRIDARLVAMLQHGAWEEVRALMDATPDLPPMGMPIREWCLTKPPIYRAHGVPELMAALRGEMSPAAALAKAQQNTRNYAKRQMTWLRNQLPEAVEVREVAEILGATASLN